jgi:hypothetical protein
MGKLMALALVTTMAAAVLFQPVLMGPPRERAKKTPIKLLPAAPAAAASVPAQDAAVAEVERSTNT